MATPSPYINEAQQRLLQTIDLLAGNEVQGLAPGEIAKAMGCAASQVTRDMANLQHAGWAERTPSERWRLSPHAIQLSLRFAAGLAESERVLKDITQRFGRC
jgi:DNA-binding IclR family transcriptional regulator